MALFKLVWVLIAVPEKNALFESAFAEGNLFAVLQSLVDTLYGSHKGHGGWQKPRCGSWLLQITHLGKGVSPQKNWAGGNLPAVLPGKPGKEHEAWLMKKGYAHIYEPFIVCLDQGITFYCKMQRSAEERPLLFHPLRNTGRL